MMGFKTLLCCSLIAVASMSTAVVASADEVTLKAASFLPPRASFGWPFAKWVEETNKQCAGKVKNYPVRSWLSQSV